MGKKDLAESETVTKARKRTPTRITTVTSLMVVHDEEKLSCVLKLDGAGLVPDDV